MNDSASEIRFVSASDANLDTAFATCKALVPVSAIVLQWQFQRTSSSQVAVRMHGTSGDAQLTFMNDYLTANPNNRMVAIGSGYTGSDGDVSANAAVDVLKWYVVICYSVTRRRENKLLDKK